MSKRVTVTLVDDVDGESDAEETVTFAIDGVNYEIDLANKNAEKLRARLQPWIAAARRTGGRHSRGGAGRAGRVGRGQGAAIRAWARREGLDISERGRIPRSVVEAYQRSA